MEQTNQIENKETNRIVSDQQNICQANKRSKLSLKSKDSFRKYGIKTYNIEANGKDWNKYQYIERKGNPIAILSSKYQVLPNELVIEKADQIAQKVKEFAEKTGGQIYTRWMERQTESMQEASDL